jgi:RHS repeat-associated protein
VKLKIYVAILLGALIGMVVPAQDLSSLAALGPRSVQAASGAQPVRPQIFVPPGADRTPVGGKPGGTFGLQDRQSGEIVGLRTRTSRTYASGHGNFVAVISQGSINYPDAQGNLQPIDNALVTGQTAGSYQNQANRYRLTIPASLGSGPIQVSSHGVSVAFSLVGANGTATVSGDTASVPNALPSTTLSISAGNDEVKESLTLASPGAPASFTYRIVPSPGLTARSTPQGEIDFVDAAGHVTLALAAPIMNDASTDPTVAPGAVSTALTTGPDGLVLTVTPDRGWLLNPARKWPVVIDPTVLLQGANQDCYIVGGSSSGSNFCGAGNLDVGFDGTLPGRTMLQFNVQNVLPTNAQVLNADLALYLYGESASTTTPVDLDQVTQAWTTKATWNTYDGSHAWTAPGGDFNGTPAATNPKVGVVAGWYHWYPTRLVQGWLNGTVSNAGLILKEPTENVNNLLAFYSSHVKSSSAWPYLKITYEPWVGQQSFYTLTSHQLNDRMALHVNVTNGNLEVQQDDLKVKGTGLNLQVSRTYNNLSANTADLGNSWVMDGGRDVGLLLFADGSAGFYGPTGYQIPFIKNSDGSFTPPTGIDATLQQNTDGTFTLTFNVSGEKLNFTSGGFLVSEVDKSANKISFAYTSSNLLSSITDTQGRVTTFTYGKSGFISSMTDSASRLYQYAYDRYNNLVTYTDPAGKVTQFGYDAYANLVQITDPNGNLTKLTYDGSYRVTSMTFVTNAPTGAGVVNRFTYNAGNTVVTDGNGNATTYNYDAQARVTRTVDPLGNASTASFTADSKPLQTTSPAGSTTTATYDARNNVTRGSSNGLSESAAYGDVNHPFSPTSQTNSENITVGYNYTPAGNVAQRTDPLAHTTTYAYNANATMSSVTDALGNVTTYTYDQYGNLTKVSYPAPLGAESYAYDALSRLSSSTDGKGQKTTYAYDVLDRMTLTTYADGSSISAAYDADGNAVASTDPSGTQTRNYDALNRLVKQTLPTGKVISYGWDGDNNLTSETDSAGTITQQFNAIDQPIAIIDRAGGRTTLQNSASAGTSSSTYPNGVTETFTSNANGQITNVSARNAQGSVLTSFTYGYVNPATGLPTALRYSVTDAAGNVTSYSYDVMGRLTSATTTSSTGSVLSSDTYAYDAVGNMTSETLNGVTTSMTFNGADQLTQASTAGNTISYGYDQNGSELGNSAGLALAYNAAGQTTSITPPGGSAMQMTYSGTGQGVRVQAGTTAFQYDLGGIDTTTTGATTTSFTRLPNDMELSETNPTGIYYYLHDILGSVVALTDASGAVVNKYSYDPYGNIASQTEQVGNPFKWIGAIWDAPNQLYKMGDRYYSPSLGRFTQVDPAHQCLNGYAYAHDNPVNLSDPNGDFDLWCGGWRSWHSGWGWWTFDFLVWCTVDFEPMDLSYFNLLATAVITAAIGAALATAGIATGLAFIVGVAMWVLGNIVASLWAPNGIWFTGYVRGHVQWNWPWYWHNWQYTGWYWGFNSWCADTTWGPCVP